MTQQDGQAVITVDSGVGMEADFIQLPHNTSTNNSGVEI